MYQIIAQTKEEKTATYMKLTKKQLIEMLIEKERIIITLPGVSVTDDNHNVISYGYSPKCDICGKEMGNFFQDINGKYCIECFNKKGFYNEIR